MISLPLISPPLISPPLNERKVLSREKDIKALVEGAFMQCSGDSLGNSEVFLWAFVAYCGTADGWNMQWASPSQYSGDRASSSLLASYPNALQSIL